MDMMDNLFLIGFSFLLGALLAWAAAYLLGIGKPAGSNLGPAEADPDLAEVVQVWRVRKSGEMVIEVEGQVFRSPAGLSASQLQALSKTAAGLSSWLAVPAPAPAATQAEPPLPPAPILPQPEPAPPPRLATLAERLSQAESPVQPVKPRPLDAAARLFNPAPPPPQVKSIPMQIDEILQARLAASPLAGRAIRLEELPGQGVSIFVDGERFPAVDSLTDPAVRELVKAAVSEWERKARGVGR